MTCVNNCSNQSCPGDTFIYNNTKCVTSCPTEANFIFNTSCVYECPGTHPINYTKNGKGYGIYQCVESCPNNSYIYNETCYDKCPGKLKTHLFTCIEKCPTSYPYGNIQPLDKELLQKANIIKCLKMCPNGTVINEYFCDKQCPTDMPYLEKNQCVKVCHNPSAVYEITNQGKKCYDTCPNHLLLMDDICVEKCPTNRLIIESSCKNTKKCPYHIYQEQLEIGKRCTNKCSSTFYLDGSDCIKECPQQKVIAGMNCLDECPLSFPLSHKDFSSKPRVHCYGICPSGYVANGTECIESSKCHDKNHFTYNNRCYDKCPDLTIEYGNKSCMSMNIFITFLVVCILFIVILLTFVYIATCFNGWSSRRKKCTLTHKQENQGYQDANKSYTPPLELLEDDVENKQSEHFNNIKLRSDSQDIREELDDGFTINIERDNTVKYKRVTKAETVKSNVQLMHRNDNNETKDNHVEVLSIDKR
ncbi:uncharacterized protein LOC143066447 [Mytilus galloprovincialis]|uniref:uncharacterized protein LOC143066447 n=1 Tax=Mytilus galloprovincialis TaxID=29158 RepID=UPI003F7C2BD0